MKDREVSAARTILVIYAAVFLLTLYGPFVTMFILSFQGKDAGPTFPLQGTSLFWYQKLFFPRSAVQDIGYYVGEFGHALARSMIVAVATMFISTALGTMAAQAFRKPFKYSGAAFYMFLLGIMIPGIIISFGLARFWQQIGVDLHWYSTSLIVHVLWTLPFCFVIMLVLFKRFDARVEEAAMAAGANEWQTFRHVTMPIMTPGLMASMLFGFTLSFDEFPRTILVNGERNTLPLDIFGALTVRVEPRLFALGTITTLISFTIIGVYLALSRRATKMLRYTGQEEIE